MSQHRRRIERNSGSKKPLSRISKTAEKLMESEGIDASVITPNAKGRITLKEVKAYLAAQEINASPETEETTGNTVDNSENSSPENTTDANPENDPDGEAS